MRFVNAMANVAEAEGHHPDFCVHWNRVDVTIWTHAVGGLTENDFVLAAKVGRLVDAARDDGPPE
jgi:4a-hydroxytetrahydrobiopterin dehydratase